MKSFITIVIWLAFLALAGHFLISAIPLVAPDADKENIKVILESNQQVIVAFFGFLGVVVGLLQTIAGKTTDFTSVSGLSQTEPSPDVSLDKCRSRLREYYDVAKKLEEVAKRYRQSAIKGLTYRVALWIAVQFAVCHIVSAGLQGALQKAYPLGEVKDARFFVLAYAQSEILLLCAFMIPLRQHVKLLRRTDCSSQVSSTVAMIRIGALGIFLCGMVSLITLSPEQISSMLVMKDPNQLPILEMNYFVFLAATRLVLFPALGFIASWIAVSIFGGASESD